MSNWNRSDVIALSSLMVSIVAIIIGVAIPEVRCFVGLQSESCPSSTTNQEQTQNDEQPKSSPPNTTVEPGTNLISKSTGVDYNRLRDLLAAGKWWEADLETENVMLQAANREKEGWLRFEDVNNFSCEDLRIIDQLWLESSQGKFGFSVQNKIYQDLGGTIGVNDKAWWDFYTQVGWMKWIEGKGVAKNDSELTFNLNARRGHLPTYRTWLDRPLGATSLSNCEL